MTTEKTEEEPVGPYCFLDASRLCDSDCASYLMAAPAEVDLQGHSFSRCSLLVSVNRLVKHSTAILKHLHIRTSKI